mmetsp:Transcript_46401/g.145182  ORF Transcript_46401/g.145182 Transcript_46401/m.145182 type:complete len:241 (+) Transcript_46401:936-1658(+)
MQDGGEQAPDVGQLGLLEAAPAHAAGEPGQHARCRAGRGQGRIVIQSFDVGEAQARYGQLGEVGWDFREPQVVRQLPVARRGQEHVKDVEGAFPRVEVRNARLLEEEGVDPAAEHLAAEVDLQLHVLAEARRVVVALGLRVAEGLEHGVGLEQARAHAERRRALLRLVRAEERGAAARGVVHGDARIGHEAHDLLRRLRLAGAALARHEHALRRRLLQQVLEGEARDGVGVRRELHRVLV